MSICSLVRCNVGRPTLIPIVCFPRERRCRLKSMLVRHLLEWAVMSAEGHPRRFGRLCRMSAVPPLATEERTSVGVAMGQDQTHAVQHCICHLEAMLN